MGTRPQYLPASAGDPSRNLLRRGTLPHVLRWLACWLLLGMAACGVRAGELAMTGWTGPAGLLTAEAVAGASVPLQPVPAGTTHRLSPDRELWLRLRLDLPAEPMVLEFASPIVDRITVHQRDEQGGWRAHSAGDRVPLKEWPIAGRYASFPLAGNGPVEVLVQVRHPTPVLLPIELRTRADFEQRVQFEYLGLGVALGAVALIVAHCLLRASLLRDSAYLLLAGNALLCMVSVAAITGVAGHLLWGGAGAWTDVAPGVLALLAAGMACFVGAELTAAAARMPALGRALQLLGWCSVPLALTYAALPRAGALVLVGLYLLAVTVLSLVAAVTTHRRGDVVGRWMLCGAIPLVGAVFVGLARSLGWLGASWVTDYALVLALLNNLPMLLGALNSRSRERRSAKLRQLASEYQDPLTGLAPAKVFYARVRQALRRHAAHREPAAIAFVELANLSAIKEARGAEGAEETILRAVLQLRGLLRDIDTAGRIGEARFGVILDGVADRQRATEFASRLVAAGLRATGGGEERPLRFHAMLVVLDEHAAPADQVLRDLAAGLGQMSPRTRRPIRFLPLPDAATQTHPELHVAMPSEVAAT
ncbi:MAG TPA: 7TM diverse intracellular signaling domain-containing protein [Ramlibacter sp.]|nr:7TM diverse intracellular signaling domain-containing protein [Ramlibacter sp.]